MIRSRPRECAAEEIALPGLCLDAVNRAQVGQVKVDLPADPEMGLRIEIILDGQAVNLEGLSELLPDLSPFADGMAERSKNLHRQAPLAGMSGIHGQRIPHPLDIAAGLVGNVDVRGR